MRQHRSKILIIFFAGMVFSGCGVTGRLAQSNVSYFDEFNNPNSENLDSGNVALKEPLNGVSTGSSATTTQGLIYAQIQSTLRNAYHKWKGTPYQWGGTTLQGADCSGFLQTIFRYYFGIKIPRTTHQQIHAGTKVSRQHLKPGDLIFFKTGRRSLHVGVVIDMPRFMHSSSSQGVTISSLQNYYWRSRYLTARRVLN